jgi:hypothetical protein
MEWRGRDPPPPQNAEVATFAEELLVASGDDCQDSTQRSGGRVAAIPQLPALNEYPEHRSHVVAGVDCDHSFRCPGITEPMGSRYPLASQPAGVGASLTGGSIASRV